MWVQILCLQETVRSLPLRLLSLQRSIGEVNLYERTFFPNNTVPVRSYHSFAINLVLLCLVINVSIF